SYYGGRYPFFQTGDISQSGGRVASWNQTLNDKGKGVSRSFPRGTIVSQLSERQSGPPQFWIWRCSAPTALWESRSITRRQRRNMSSFYFVLGDLFSWPRLLKRRARISISKRCDPCESQSLQLHFSRPFRRWWPACRICSQPTAKPCVKASICFKRCCTGRSRTGRIIET